MGNDAGWKDQSSFLRCGIHRSQQAPTGELRAARLRINADLSHSRQVNHQAAIAGTKTCKAVSSATDGGEHSSFRRGTHSVLDIAHICATRNQARRAIKHAIPDAPRIFKSALARTQQIAFKVRRRNE